VARLDLTLTRWIRLQSTPDNLPSVKRIESEGRLTQQEAALELSEDLSGPRARNPDIYRSSNTSTV